MGGSCINCGSKYIGHLESGELGDSENRITSKDVYDYC